MSFGILIAYIIGAVVEWQVMCFVIGSLPIVLGLSMVNKGCILETNAQGKEIHLCANPHCNLVDFFASPIMIIAFDAGNTFLACCTPPGTSGQGRASTTSRQVSDIDSLKVSSLHVLIHLDFMVFIANVFRYTNVETEFQRIKTNASAQLPNSSYAKILTNKYLIKPLLISMALMFFQQFSGINAIVFYSASVFQDAGSSLDSFISSIIIGIVQMVFTMISVLLVSIFF